MILVSLDFEYEQTSFWEREHHVSLERKSHHGDYIIIIALNLPVW